MADSGRSTSQPSFFVAGVLFAPLIWLFRARWPRGREEWLLVSWVGLMMFAGDYGLIYWGEQFLDSGLTAILFATLPLITILFAHAHLPGERITLRKLTGTLVAFFGVAGLFGDRVRLDAAQAGPMLAIVASACVLQPSAWQASDTARRSIRRRSMRRR